MVDEVADLLPLAKRFVWRMRDDVRKGQSSNLSKFSPAFEQWWLLRGRSEYPEWAELSADHLAWLSEPRGALKLGNVELPLPQALSILLQYRPDVLQTFTVNKQLNVGAVAGWFFAIGIRDHLLQEMVGHDWLCLLDRPVLLEGEEIAGDVPSATLLMHLVWHMLDAGLQAAMPLIKSATRERFIVWFFAVAVPKFELQALVSSRWRHWLQQEIALAAQPQLALPRFAQLMHAGVISVDEGAKLAAWAEQAQQPNNAWHWLRVSQQANVKLAASSTADVPVGEKPMGVNLYGFAVMVNFQVFLASNLSLLLVFAALFLVYRWSLSRWTGKWRGIADRWLPFYGAYRDNIAAMLLIVLSGLLRAGKTIDQAMQHIGTKSGSRYMRWHTRTMQRRVVLFAGDPGRMLNTGLINDEILDRIHNAASTRKLSDSLQYIGGEAIDGVVKSVKTSAIIGATALYMVFAGLMFYYAATLAIGNVQASDNMARATKANF